MLYLGWEKCCAPLMVLVKFACMTHPQIQPSSMHLGALTAEKKQSDDGPTDRPTYRVTLRAPVHCSGTNTHQSVPCTGNALQYITLQ